MRLWRFVPLIVLAAGSAPAQDQAAAPLTEDEKINHVLSRLTFGPRPGDVAAVKAVGLAKWLDQQLDPATPAGAAVEDRTKGFETLGLAPTAFNAFVEKKSKEGGKAADREAVKRKCASELRHAIIIRALWSERQAFEVLTDFWRNHFNVDMAKDTVQWTATHYEESALRPNVLGRFGDMLEATAHHPAMLIYLDNAISRRPPPKSELRQLERRIKKKTGSAETAKEQVEIARQSGLNENYARELMELHTLGVDNGYVQKDVTEVARALTGWSVDYEGEGSGFAFKDDMHDTGPKIVLGRALPEGKQREGIIEGDAVLKRLAGHDNTAEFIAKKLVRYLVNDAAPDAVVQHAAKAFKRAKGDLRETVRAILGHPEFFGRAHFRSKFKTPIEFVISTLRATNATVTSPQAVMEATAALGQLVYGMEDPTGWSDTAEAWRDPGVMALRWKFAVNLAEGHAQGMMIPPSFYEGLPADPLEIAQELTRRIVPAGLGPATAAVIERVVFQEVQAQKAKDDAGRRKLARRLTGILLGSPEFQQQ